jgi:penicillin-binding protein 2
MRRRFRPKLGQTFAEAVSFVRRPRARVRQSHVSLASLWQEGLLLGRATPPPKFISIARMVPLYLFFFLGFVVLVARLFLLQVMKGEENLVAASENRIRFLSIHAPRGEIFDRNGACLAQNKPGFRLVQDREGKRSIKFLSYEEALAWEASEHSLLDSLEIDFRRSYPKGEILAHILGFVGEISSEELKYLEFANYKLGDQIGKMGIEKIYEDFLSGVDGRELIEIDAKGIKKRVLGKEEPKRGLSTFLTLDSDLSEKMFFALKEGLEKSGSWAGTAIAQDPNDGQILGMVSFPTFNSNYFAASDSEKISSILKNPLSPLVNRATVGLYPPGSIFKIVTAAAGLTTGKIDKDTKILDTGILYLGSYSFANWYYTARGKTEGLLDLVGAIKRSNDIFFYQVGRTVGEEILGKFASLFGLGKKTGIDLSFEEAGLVPDPKWKETEKKIPWYPGDTLHMAIGQGDILVTPLQISNMVAAVANGGVLYKPKLLLKIIDHQGEEVVKFEPETLTKQLVSLEHIGLIREGMRQACQQGGTGWPFFDFELSVACKTGTAEFGPSASSGQVQTHAWFTVYAPAEDPKIVVTVLIEGGGEGADVAAPVAREILEYWFNR